MDGHPWGAAAPRPDRARTDRQRRRSPRAPRL